MNAIWKFSIDQIADEVELTMPLGAKICTVASVQDTLCIWAYVNTEAEKERRIFRIFGTGHPIPVDKEVLTYVGTVITLNGVLVWHIFEKLSPDMRMLKDAFSRSSFSDAQGSN